MIVSAHGHWDEDECGGDEGCDSIEDEPDCEDGLRHSWTSEGEGGCDENPGVWSLGGTTYSFSEHCRYCGVRRLTLHHGRQRNPYECDSVRYEEGDRDEAAITEALRRIRRRKRAAARRRAAKVAHYGSVDAWRAALRARRAALLAQNRRELRGAVP
jgi:hypothetical protein